MSHEIKHYEYSEKTSKKAIEEELKTFVRMTCIQEGGQLGRIQWFDNTICDSLSAAEEFLEVKDKPGDYRNLAVRFRVPAPGNKKIDELRGKAAIARGAYNQADRVVATASMKSAFVACKSCGSKLNREKLRSNFCPVCRADMRSKTELARINRLLQKALKTEEELEMAEKAAAKRGTVKWLVKIEYHT